MLDRFTIILPTAGKSSRFGAALKKPFIPLAGRPIWFHSAALFAARPDVGQLIIVLATDDRGYFESTFEREMTLLRRSIRLDLADGGRERIDSVRNALRLLDPDTGMIAVHDAARPCVRPEEIDAVFDAARETGAALLAVPIVGTIKRGTDDRRVATTVPRENLWEAQTPQVFRRDLLLRAYAQVTDDAVRATDDARLLELLGHPVHIVPGSRANIKITTADDLRLAELFLPTTPLG